MIINCESCQTRFRVPDDKVTDQGTWVRCAVCQSTFQVKRGAASIPEADPFELLADAPPVPPPRPPPAAKAAHSSPLGEELFGDLSYGDLSSEDPQSPALDLAPAVSPEPDRSMFELPERLVEVVPEARELLPSQEEMLPPAPPRARSLLSEFTSERPAAPAPWPEQRSIRARRSWAGLLINLGTGATLVPAILAVVALYANEGKLDRSSLSPSRWKSLLSPAREMIAAEISNGLYDTRAGKPVFYIRGEAENRGLKPTKLKVRAEILDGEQLVRSSEVLAGAIATPEDLYNIGSAEDAEALGGRLDRAGKEVLPSQRAPFLLTFYDYPPNLSAFHLKITVTNASSGETAAR